MTAAGNDRSVRTGLDEVCREARSALSRSAAQDAFIGTLRTAAPLMIVVPLAHVTIQVARLTTGASPRFMPLWALVLVVLVVPLAVAAFAAVRAYSCVVGRGNALAEADRQLELEGRLRAADELLERSEPTPFERAAVEDAAEKLQAARNASLQSSAATFDAGRRLAAHFATALAIVIVAGWLGSLQPALPSPAAHQQSDSATIAGLSPDVIDETREPDDPRIEDARENEPEATDDRPKAADTNSESATASPDVGDATKESTGKTGAGRSSGALSSSAASESRGAPSSQGKESDSSDRKQKKNDSTKKPKEVEDQPPPVEEQQDEESGSTAGKGSSKGSNKNPTASDWKSRDQVTDEDDQEIEDDEDTEEDEEEQENRGGVQPSLRDRRPPVSRDLQIGFGNRPNPDANGRGGPSEQKKSRGVASLVLGVPIPDRIKGRPGPGPTKITQERIEPRTEDADPINAQPRTARDEPAEAPADLVVEPGLQTLVRRYFLGRRGRDARN